MAVSKRRRVEDQLAETKSDLLLYGRRLWNDGEYGNIQFRVPILGRVDLTLWPYRGGRHWSCMCMKLFDFNGVEIDWDTEEAFDADMTEWSWTRCRVPTTRYSNVGVIKSWMLKVIPIRFPTVELLADHLKQSSKLNNIPIEVIDLVASFAL